MKTKACSYFFIILFPAEHNLSDVIIKAISHEDVKRNPVILRRYSIFHQE
jgi:hypothetical protein